MLKLITKINCSWAAVLSIRVPSPRNSSLGPISWDKDHNRTAKKNGTADKNLKVKV